MATLRVSAVMFSPNLSLLGNLGGVKSLYDEPSGRTKAVEQFRIPRPDPISFPSAETPSGFAAESVFGPSQRLSKWRCLIPISTSFFIFTRTNSTPFTQGHGQTRSGVLLQSDLVISESHNAHSPQVVIFKVYSDLFLLHTNITSTPPRQGHDRSGSAILPASGGNLKYYLT
ncbi:uncharacterized protein BDR25DRAFT_358258 [Lindgomyces ingoldianus]|uniref:Uncharacterized protein n=1 Tax=Lindgomyces ingoldianus TaxID=673940 RepID=A0ACB6QM63_9PLEO|nr:uncharacterized protein BDR25DRAFT_358258 [Lindgomyces ingoldianus]KAF2468001.1 hypothetical protein BDR25DRAFT_358258 [Lindgomyces ingoldianus]